MRRNHSLQVFPGLRNASSITKARPATFAPTFSTVPLSLLPSTGRGKIIEYQHLIIMTQRVFMHLDRICPYSSAYVAEMVLYGSFPFLRTGMNGTPSFRASAARNETTRFDSRYGSHSLFLNCLARISITFLKSFGFFRTGVISLKTIPGLGKSGMSRIASWISSYKPLLMVERRRVSFTYCPPARNQRRKSFLLHKFL